MDSNIISRFQYHSSKLLLNIAFLWNFSNSNDDGDDMGEDDADEEDDVGN